MRLSNLYTNGTLFIIVFSFCMLSACGSKGALYLPADPEPVVSNEANVKSDTESDIQIPAPEVSKDSDESKKKPSEP